MTLASTWIAWAWMIGIVGFVLFAIASVLVPRFGNKRQSVDASTSGGWFPWVFMPPSAHRSGVDDDGGTADFGDDSAGDSGGGESGGGGDGGGGGGGD